MKNLFLISSLLFLSLTKKPNDLTNGQLSFKNDYANLKIDTNLTPPILSIKEKTATTIELSWVASPDETIIKQYKIYKDGQLEEALEDNLSYKFTGLTTNTQYSFSIKAVSASGQESESSNVLVVKTL